jgi:transcriptional regulator GlxA family with amidase domain
MLKVDILAVPETSASVLYGLYDTLMLPGTAWPRVVLGRPGEPLIQVRIVARTQDNFSCRGNVPVSPHISITDANSADVICVPNVTIPVDENPHGRYADEIRWLVRQYKKGATIMTVCSGALILAEAKLLDGQAATAHWAYRDMFRNYYPSVDFHPERILTFAGDAKKLVMAGGMSSWHDLALYLISKYLGAEHAVQVAKFYLMDSHKDGQLPYAAMSRTIQKEDQIVEQCQRWLAEHYHEAGAIQTMSEMSGLPRRTFSRRFKACTGYSPQQYLQAVRVEEAKQLLETSQVAIDDVVDQVGYGDERAFRKIFKKMAGITPSAYRKRFGAGHLIPAE